MLLASGGAGRAHAACCRLLASWQTARPAAQLWSQQLAARPGLQGISTGCAPLRCLKPGQEPEDVVKRLDRGAHLW